MEFTEETEGTPYKPFVVAYLKLFSKQFYSPVFIVVLLFV